MNTQPDKLISRLVALDPDFGEWESAAPILGPLSAQLAQIMDRHKKTGEELVSRVGRDLDIDSQIAELREIFASYGPTMRTLAHNCVRVAAIAERIHAKLEKLSEP